MCRLLLLLSVAGFLQMCAGSDCQRGWTAYGSSCYVFIEDAYTWFTAQDLCQALHSAVVEIGSEAENNFVKNLAQEHGASQIWIGLEDFVIENEFVWTSSAEIPGYTNWMSNQPNNDNDNEDCAAMSISEGGVWYDKNCAETHVFVCQASARGGHVEVIG